MTNKPERNTKNALEWTVFGIGCLLVFAATWCLAWYAVNSKEGPARLLVTTAAPVLESDRVRVPITVTNSGQRVASNVQIVISGSINGTRRESSLALDYLPRGATRHASVSFHGPDIPTGLKCEATSYQEP